AAAALEGKTAYTLTLTGLRNLTGRALGGVTTLAFTTLYPSKPTLGDSGLITGDLPDEDGLVRISGAGGASEAHSAVTATNLSTQETVTPLSLDDGSLALIL